MKWIIRRTNSGLYIVEGKAKLLEHIKGNYWRIQFIDSERIENRYIDNDAQYDPYAYVARLNAEAKLNA